MEGVDGVASGEAFGSLWLSGGLRDVGLFFFVKHDNTLFLFSWKIYSNIILLVTISTKLWGNLSWK